MNVYVVTTEGSIVSEGSALYLIGVFDTKETAFSAAKENDGAIREISLNTVFPMSNVGDGMEVEYSNGKTEVWYDRRNENYLGGCGGFEEGIA